VGKGRGAATVRSLPDMGCRSCGRSCTRPRPVDAAGVGIEWPRSPALQYQLLCDVKTRPASCRGLAFRHFLGRCRPCTSASRLLGRRNCCRACRGSTLFDETKIRSSRGCFRSSARLCRSAQEARKSRSMCKHGPRSKLLRRAILSLYGTGRLTKGAAISCPLC